MVNTGSLRCQLEHEKIDSSTTVARMSESAAAAGNGLDELRKLQREQGGIVGDVSYDEGDPSALTDLPHNLSRRRKPSWWNFWFLLHLIY